MSRLRVLLAAEVHEVLLRYFQDTRLEVVPYDAQLPISSQLADCIGLVTSNKLLVDRSLIDAAPHLKWIARLGSGMEIIDTVYARAKGIACISSPEGNSNAVAEHTLGLLLALTKNIHRSANEVKKGLWRREENRGRELEQMVLGIVGFGNVGRTVANKMKGLVASISAFDVDKTIQAPGYVTLKTTMDALLEDVDILSFHIPLLEENKGFFSWDLIAKANRPFYLLNASRGGILDYEALAQGLLEGKIIGAGLDVWKNEPPISSKELDWFLDTDRNVILTPHIAGYSEEAMKKMSEVLVYKLKAL